MVVSRNILDKFLFVTGTINGISRSFTWMALTHGAGGKISIREKTGRIVQASEV